MTDFSPSLEDDFVSNYLPPLAKKPRDEIFGHSEGRLKMLDNSISATASGIVPLKLEKHEYQVLEVNLYSGSLEPEDVSNKDEDTELWCKCLPPLKGEGGCGEGCENRMRRVECRREYCRAGHECENMAISNRTADKVRLDQGRLVATEGVAPGRFLAQYTGEVISRQELEVRLIYSYKTGQNVYVLPLGDGAVVDATSKGGQCRLAIHSCSPNTEIITWMVELGGEPQLCLAMYSLRKIQVGEPLSYDYSAQQELLNISKLCNCGARNCKRLLGASVTMTGPIQCTACQVGVMESGMTGEVCLHPSLALPLCRPCKVKLQQVDWKVENICRWCTRTDKEGFSCYNCKSHFCRKCLNVNLGPGYIKLAEASVDSWTCLLCNSSPLEKPRSRLIASSSLCQGRTGVSPGFSPEISRGGSPVPSQGVSSMVSHGVSPGVSPGFSPEVGLGVGLDLNPGIRQIRPQSIRPVRPFTPKRTRASRGGAPSRGRLPTPRNFGPGVSIQSVPTPATSPTPQPQKNREVNTSKILSHLQRCGLSIQPVSEQEGQMESILKELEGAEKILHGVVSEARRQMKDGESISKIKDHISEKVRNIRGKLTQVEEKNIGG